MKLLVLLFGLLLLAVPANAAPSAEACAGLARADFTGLPDAPTALTAATVVEAANDLPAYCRVEGTIAPQVGFELRMPMTTWNGKYLQQGCGGMCGWINMGACEDALARDYAVANTDMGHKGAPNSALWALNNRQAEIDFAYRATYVTSLAAKAIIARFYGTPASRAYFRGCSTGGRQALVLAQRFPHAFDGIIAGAPVLNQTGVGILHLLWSGRAPPDPTGKPLLTPAHVDLVRRSVMTACDGRDGLEDGIIQDPTACRWAPRALTCGVSRGADCLTGAQVAAVERLYGGARDAAGRPLFPGGMPRGSEHQWVPAFVGANGATSLVMGPGSLIRDVLRYQVFWDDPGAAADPMAFDFDRDADRLRLVEPLYNAQNPDLSAFEARGGKLIMWHGWDDLEIPATLSIDYFRRLEAAMGGREAARGFARMFLLPGVAHCRRGPGPDTFDELGYLEAWVERGVAPDVVTAHKLATEQNYLGLPRPRFPLKPAEVRWTRPVPAYPLVAVRRGAAPPEQARAWRFVPMSRP